MKVIKLFKNETDLIARALKNSRQAQHQLYQLYSGKMLSVCRIYIKDVHEAEEAMLNGFFKVFTHLKDFKNEGSFEGWMRRIMVRESISFLRQKKQMYFQEETEKLPDESFSNIQSDLEVSHIQKLIDELPEGYRAVFVMYAIEGYKHQEIAKILDIDTGTSKSQLFKARKMLQEKLKNTSDYGATQI